MQALTLMNDPFVHEQADRWSQRLINDGSETTEQRIDAMFLAAIGRAPTDLEREAFGAYLADQAQRLGLSGPQVLTDPRPWRELCHSVFNLNSFIYVR